MHKPAFARFEAIREDFKDRVAAWTAALPGLADAQRALAREAGDEYVVETPIVYNRALDDVGPGADVSWVVVADNPGKREQEAAMNRYLVGRSGMVAERFFARELGVDFRREVVIINKTPVHTPKTVQLRKLAKLYPEAAGVLEESQRYMASIAPALQACFGASVWVMGLSEVRPKGLFDPWRQALVDAYARADAGSDDEAGEPSPPRSGRPSERLYGFNHFSMGSFATDLKRRRLEGESTKDAVLRIGEENRSRIL
ncbi:MAG: hypothetical protein KKA67_01120 [Spirochaetes bacterium]|nr:hypothetical protein [Spirochaetota bacterium]MBU1081274.1 hypothetical protein [Spirochaetota bacterium]